MKITELHNQPVEADTYEASMALNQLLKIGKHAIKIHNMIDDAAEMEAWVAKKIDLAGDYVKKVHGYMQGEKAGLYDDGGLTEGMGEKIANMAQNMSKDEFMSHADELGLTPEEAAEHYEKMSGGAHAGKFEDAGEGHMSKSTLYHTAKYAIELMSMIRKGDDLEGWVQSKLNKAADYLQGVHNYEEYQKLNPYREELDSSTLQRHAGIIQKHIDEILARETSLDDVDTKPGMMRILAKRVNEVEKEIAKEQRKDTDEEAPPGREKQVKALKKKFKDKGAPYAIAWAQHNKHGKPKKEAEINEDPRAVGKALANLKYGKDMANAILKDVSTMSLKAKAQAYLDGVDDTIELLDQMYPKQESGILYRAGVKKYGKAGMKAIQSAAGKGASHQEIGKIKDKHLKDDEQIQEGIKDWAKNLAMAGVIVAGLAGVNSIQDAIDRSVPAVAAMEKALEMAQDQGNDELAKMIKGDLSAVKVRLSSGKDLNFVKGMQEKYSKFIQTEGLAYESRLAVRLEQRIK